MKHWCALVQPALRSSLLLMPIALGGCLARVPNQPDVAQSIVATVPVEVFVATPMAAAPPAIPAVRYTISTITPLSSAVPGNSYAAALLNASTKGIQITLQVNGLGAPTPPSVSYELVTDSGVFRPLADGEWGYVTAQGDHWMVAGRLVFIVPRELHRGQLVIADYYYPQMRAVTVTTPETLAPLIRRPLVRFTLDRLP